MGKFEEAYKDLNDEQRKVVDTTEGPLLVIAGPGTGKTQLLGTRVANILRNTDAYPENILCLTFTNKAADNMSRRLVGLIGAEANAVEVRTFHGLAAEIMNRHPEYFWRGARLAIAPDSIQLEIMHTILSGLAADHPLALKFAGQFTLVDDVVGAISLSKEAGLTPGKLEAIINANVQYLDQIEPDLKQLGEFRVGAKTIDKFEFLVASLPEQPIDELIAPLTSLATVIKQSYDVAKTEYAETSKTTSISKWKTRWVQKRDGEYGMFEERKRNSWWHSIAGVYSTYRQLMHSRGYYDYADMLVEVISQIEQHEDLRASLQEQYQHVMIDEFQDTNAAQLRLAHLIADHPDLHAPNLMAVGDDDQSIFKFQGAELSNMLGFTRQYPSANLVVLTKNYRSTQGILDSSEVIIKNARYRLVNRLPNLSKKLNAAGPPSTKTTVVHQAYRSREEELAGLAKTAGRLFKEGKTVAILARHHSSLRDMSMILHQNHQPIAYEQNNNILDLPVIEQTYLILKILAEIKKGRVSQVNELLSRTLSHPMWDIRPQALWEFAISQQAKHDWLSGLLANKDKELNRAGRWLEELLATSSSEPLAVVLELVLGLRPSDSLRSPVGSHYLSGEVSQASIESLSAVQLLRSLVGEFSSQKAAKVEDFVQFVDLIKQSNKIIADNSPFVSGEKCIELLTVYKAKGLEFDAVIVVDAVRSEWSPRVHGRVPPANLPLRPAEDDSDDYVRLMYVAATRAKHTLLIGSHKLNNKGEDVMPATALEGIKVTPVKPSRGRELVITLEQSLMWPRLEQADERALLKPKLETYSLNVSNLINFLNVLKGGPQYFKQRNLLRLPEAKSPSAAVGSAIHAALEEAQLLMNKAEYEMEPVIAKFEQRLLDEGLPEIDYKKRLASGRRILNKLLGKDGQLLNKGALPEYKIIDIYLDEVRLGGTFDVLDNTGEQTVIIDYKTGRPLSSLNSKSSSEGIKAWQHKLQLTFYALLAELDSVVKVKPPISCQMIYVEADKKSELVGQYSPTKDDLTRLGSLARVVWRHIMDLNFPDTGKYPQNLAGIQQFEEDLIAGKI